MGPDSVRSLLALMVVGTFMLITAAMALYPLVSPTAVPINTYADFFAKTAGVYTGIVGVVIGYYFGRSERNSPSEPIRPANVASNTDADIRSGNGAGA